jgi:hypothetical protein
MIVWSDEIAVIVTAFAPESASLTWKVSTGVDVSCGKVWFVRPTICGACLAGGAGGLLPPPPPPQAAKPAVSTASPAKVTPFDGVVERALAAFDQTKMTAGPSFV